MPCRVKHMSFVPQYPFLYSDWSAKNVGSSWGPRVKENGGMLLESRQKQTQGLLKCPVAEFVAGQLNCLFVRPLQSATFSFQEREWIKYYFISGITLLTFWHFA